MAVQTAALSAVARVLAVAMESELDARRAALDAANSSGKSGGVGNGDSDMSRGGAAYVGQGREVRSPLAAAGLGSGVRAAPGMKQLSQQPQQQQWGPQRGQLGDQIFDRVSQQVLVGYILPA